MPNSASVGTDLPVQDVIARVAGFGELLHVLGVGDTPAMIADDLRLPQGRPSAPRRCSLPSLHPLATSH